MKKEDEKKWLRSTMKRRDIIRAIPEDALNALCREYDIEMGEYPESDYEGCALSTFFWGLMQDEEDEEESGM